MMIDPRERATILAALRCFQGRFGQPYLCGDWTDAERIAAVKENYRDQFDRFDPLSPDEINALYDKLFVEIPASAQEIVLAINKELFGALTQLHGFTATWPRLGHSKESSERLDTILKSARSAIKAVEELMKA